MFTGTELWPDFAVLALRPGNGAFNNSKQYQHLLWHTTLSTQNLSFPVHYSRSGTANGKH